VRQPLRIGALMLVTIGLGVHAVLPSVAAETPSNSTSGQAPYVMSTGMRSSDLERSIRFYTQGLGMITLTTRVSGPVTEVIFGFPNSRERPAVIVFQRKGNGESLPVDHGNSEIKVVLGVPDVSAAAARLRSAGYPVEEIQQHGPYKVFWAQDPDGYRFEIVEAPEARKLTK
jgi:lactoylglutathione lyase